MGKQRLFQLRSSGRERRLAPRIGARLDCWIRVPTATTFERALAVDVTEAGARITAALSRDTRVVCNLRRPGEPMISVWGTVVWSRAGQAGVRFEVLPPDSRRTLGRWCRELRSGLRTAI